MLSMEGLSIHFTRIFFENVGSVFAIRAAQQYARRLKNSLRKPLKNPIDIEKIHVDMTSKSTLLKDVL